MTSIAAATNPVTAAVNLALDMMRTHEFGITADGLAGCTYHIDQAQAAIIAVAGEQDGRCIASHLREVRKRGAAVLRHRQDARVAASTANAAMRRVVNRVAASVAGAQ